MGRSLGGADNPLAGADGLHAFAVEAFVRRLGVDAVGREQDVIAPLLHEGGGQLLELRAVAVVGIRLGIGKSLDLGVGDQDDVHAAVVPQRIQTGQHLTPLGQGEDVALPVADVLDALDVPIRADLGEDQPLQPVQ